MRAREAIAYIRGMLDARTSLKETTDRQLYDAIVSALAALAEQIEENERRTEDQQEHMEELAGEISELRSDLDGVTESLGGGPRERSWTFGDHDDEEAFSEGDDPEEDEDLLDQYESCVCVHCGHVFFFAPGAYEDEEELQCPQCGRMFALRE